MRDSKTVSSVLKRNSVKKITLAMGQNNSFSRGFDKILQMLLVSLFSVASCLPVDNIPANMYCLLDFRQV